MGRCRLRVTVLNNGITTHGLVLMFRSPTYSEKSSEKKNVQEYFENNTNKLFDKWNKINPEYLYEKIVERNNIKIRYPIINFKKYFKKLYKEGKLHESVRDIFNLLNFSCKDGDISSHVIFFSLSNTIGEGGVVDTIVANFY